jgi:hypothetical protein
MTATTSPVTEALSAVTRSLAEHGITPVRYSAAVALYRLEYDRDGDTVAAVGWGDGLQFFEEVGTEVAALISAHAYLACAAPGCRVP